MSTQQTVKSKGKRSILLCQVSYVYADTLIKFFIRIIGPPGKCSRASSASRQSDSFSFTIARCPLNHAPPVTKYQVFYRISSSGADWSVYNYNSASQPILVEGLTPFTNYDVRVAAGNEYGYGRQNNPVIISTVEGGGCFHK